MILTVNVSNSQILLGGYQDGARVFCASLHTDPSATADEYAVRMRSVLGLYEVDPRQLAGAILSCVVPSPVSYTHLTPTFVTARPVSLAVRLAYAFALFGLVSVQAEPTFERLRYFFGGDRPSQTARLTMSPDPIQGRRLEFQYHKCGIPRLTPHRLTPVLPCLPHILYM